MKTYVYVDGFNLYYGALKGKPFRWLDLKALSQNLVPAENRITKIKYFTARVSGATNPNTPKKQQIYLSALQKYPEIEIHFGTFLAKPIWRPILNLPVGGETISSPIPVVIPSGTHSVSGNSAQNLVVGNYPVRGQKRRRTRPKPVQDSVIAQVHTMEEKGSDVNLAAHLLNDAWKELYDAAVVISNDTDLVTPIRMVTQERGKVVFVACPSRHGAAQELVNVATYVRHINRSILTSSMLPNPIPGTTIRKPSDW